MKDISSKQLRSFIEDIARLEPIEFFGVCKIMCVEVFTEEKDEKGHDIAKTADVLIEDLIDKFTQLERSRRRQILKVLDSATKGRNFFSQKDYEEKIKGDKLEEETKEDSELSDVESRDAENLHQTTSEANA